MNIPWQLWPRGRLDISWQDLLYAAAVVCWPGSPPPPNKVWPKSQPHLAMLSVRTAWDALLAVQQWPVGSEVIFSEANIPDMVRIIEEHGLIPIPVPVNPITLEVDRSEVERLITPRTRALLVSPLFGSRLCLRPLAEVAQRYGLLLVEDNAQGYSDSTYQGSPDADVTLFSFGLIKTRTALGGAVVFARDTQLLKDLREHVQNYPRLTTARFTKRLGRACWLQALSHPVLFAVFWGGLELRGKDPDEWLSQATRGMSGQELFTVFHHRAHPATLKLLRRRLRQNRDEELKARIWRGRRALEVLPYIIGKEAVQSVFWALPVCVANREELVLLARRAGFDVSFRASTLVSHSPVPTPFSHALDNAVFLPVGTPMPNREWERLLRLVADFAAEFPFVPLQESVSAI